MNKHKYFVFIYLSVKWQLMRYLEEVIKFRTSSLISSLFLLYSMSDLPFLNFFPFLEFILHEFYVPNVFNELLPCKYIKSLYEPTNLRYKYCNPLRCCLAMCRVLSLAIIYHYRQWIIISN